MQADETQNDKGSIHVHTIKNEMEWAKFAKEVVPKNSPELAEVLFETENKEVKKKDTYQEKIHGISQSGNKRDPKTLLENRPYTKN